MDLFKKVIDECHELGINQVSLGIYGEILVDEKLFEKIAYLRKYGMTYQIVTNASLLTAEKTDRLFELGGLTYVNCGDWVDSCTAIVEHHDGRLELVDWDGEIVELPLELSRSKLAEHERTAA